MKDSRQGTLCNSWYKSIRKPEDKLLSWAHKYHILLGIAGQCDNCLSNYNQKIRELKVHESTQGDRVGVNYVDSKD